MTINLEFAIIMTIFGIIGMVGAFLVLLRLFARRDVSDYSETVNRSGIQEWADDISDEWDD